MVTFTGLSAFPLTPMRHDAIDEGSFTALIERLAAAGVDSITALGSTGSYAYLSAEERARVAQLAVQHAGGTPVFVGVGALRTSHMLANIDSAKAAGAAAVLLAGCATPPPTAVSGRRGRRQRGGLTVDPIIGHDMTLGASRRGAPK